MSDIDDRIDVGTAARLLDTSKAPPLATCPRDGEPLISTFERHGAEFHCLICGGWLGWLSPTPKDETPELRARYEALKARFDAGERGPTK